jgi:hypothetical protein
MNTTLIQRVSKEAANLKITKTMKTTQGGCSPMSYKKEKYKR